MLTAICTFQIRISDTFSRLLRWLYNMHRNMNIDRIHSIIEINPLKKSQQIKFEMLKGRIRLVLTMSKSIVANVMHKWPEKKRETKINYFAIQWNVQFWNEKKKMGESIITFINSSMRTTHVYTNWYIAQKWNELNPEIFLRNKNFYIL